MTDTDGKQETARQEAIITAMHKRIAELEVQLAAVEDEHLQMQLKNNDLDAENKMHQPATGRIKNGMLGRYVIVRCHDAGVHSGILESYSGRECVLTESRRLWYWKPAKGAWLSSVAMHGLSDESKISEPVDRIHLTENCEIIQCTAEAEISICSQANYNE